MSNYTLEPYTTNRSRYNCPECNGKKTFSRYIDLDTNTHLSHEVGRCNRESKCGYHYKPRQYFADNNISLATEYGLVSYKTIKSYSQKSFKLVDVNDNIHYIPKSQVHDNNEVSMWVSMWFIESNQNKLPFTIRQTFDKEMNICAAAPTATKTKRIAPKRKPISFIAPEIFTDSLKHFEVNNFVKYLIALFGPMITTELLNRYFIGSSNLWNGATIFWQIDLQGKVRTGKIMLYNPVTGKRVKQPYKHINWAHKVLKLDAYELKQCLFGEHLLNDTSKSIAIVESEKTAMIASVYLPEFIWLAAGSLTNLQADKCRVLKGRKVVLYPDLNCYDKWSDKAKELSHITTFEISELLEKNATIEEKEKGLDIADYLIETINSTSLM